MSAGALMWICVLLYITENELSQNKATETLVSQFCIHNLDSLFKTGFHNLLAVRAVLYYLAVSRIS